MEIVPAVDGCANGSRPLPDSPALEEELSEDQRAFLECIAAEENAREMTDEEVEAHHAWWLQQQEAESIEAELEYARVRSTSAIIAAGNVATPSTMLGVCYNFTGRVTDRHPDATRAAVFCSSSTAACVDPDTPKGWAHV